MSDTSVPVIATVLDPQERNRADVYGSGAMSLVHRESIREVVRMVREREVDAVLVSIRHCDGDSSALLGRMVRRHPGIPTVALISERNTADSEALLQLGARGVRQVLDISDGTGWKRLREVFAGPPMDRVSLILTPVLDAIGLPSPGAVTFWETLVHSASGLTTIGEMSRRMRVRPSTLISRFARVGLPSPRNHLVAVRLCLAARMFDDADLAISAVAYRLCFASPQSFGRHLRLEMGITATEFRERYPFAAMRNRLIDRLVAPHAETWQHFEPLGARR